MEYRTRGHEGAERWILDTGLPRFSGEVFEGFVGSSVDVTRLGRARAELSNLSRHLIAAHERENAAVARKVHDDLCQRIMALTLQLRSMRSGPHHEDQQAAVDAITEQFSALVGELFEMPDPVYQKLELLGLTAAAERFCAQLTADNEVDVHFQHKDVPSALSPDVALNLFRVLQEAASNAVLHANARDVWVTLRGTGADVRLEVVDSGRGFDPGRDAPNGGVGLVAIRERLKLVKGDCTIESRPGLGTRVEAWVPLPQA